MIPGSRRLAAAVLAGLLGLSLTACGESDAGGSGGGSEDTSVTATPVADGTEGPPADAKVIGVTVNGDEVSPAGDKVEVDRNQPIVFEIDAAEAGELHVHSTPAISVEYPAGKSRAQITIDRPGTVEAEIEETGKLVVQLQVQ